MGAAVLAVAVVGIGLVLSVMLSGRAGRAVANASGGGARTGAVTSAPGAQLPVDPAGRQAPGFALARIDGQGLLRLSDLRGRIVVVNFWASWCTTCRQEAAALTAADRAWSGKGVTFLGIATQDAVEDARRFEREFGIGYPSVADPAGELMTWYGVTGVPETFVVDARGTVVGKWVGPIDRAGIDQLLRRATSGG